MISLIAKCLIKAGTNFFFNKMIEFVTLKIQDSESNYKMLG